MKATNAVLLGSALALVAVPAVAQDAGAPAPAKPAAAQKPAAQAKPAAPDAQKAGGGDAALRQRVEQLEEQLVDLQVVVGTLQSLAQSGAANTAAAGAAQRGGMSPADSARLDALETQMRAIASQLEQISGQPSRAAPAAQRPEAGPYTAPTASFAPPAQTAPRPADAPPAPSFGPKTVVSDQLDPIGGLIESEGMSPGSSVPPASGTMRSDYYAPGAATGAAPPPPTYTAATPPQSPKQTYETAYGHLLRQDYGAAQAGFTDFLRQYPKDALTPDALFWLGETHYVQRNYADAAEAFDLVTTSFASSNKAPEAQLRRAMALAQSGKRNDACAAFKQFTSKYPNAKPDLKSRAENERQRVGCT